MTSSDTALLNSEIVISGIGMMTASGLGIDLNIDQLKQSPQDPLDPETFKVKGFNPAPHLTDRKIVKSVSHRDVLGLVALEECLKNSKLSSQSINPDRTGLYVGAPPSSCLDHKNYEEGINLSINSYNEFVPELFGEHFKSASPTTLLTGLPNNVLCYGAKTLDARGANSNYTCLELSGHMALIGAKRALKMGRIDCAIAGGYTAHSDEVFSASLQLRGLNSPIPTAEGSVFVTVETRKHALAREVTPIATLLSCRASSEASGTYSTHEESSGLGELILETLHSANVLPNQINYLAISHHGIPQTDRMESNTIEKIWSVAHERPTILSTSRQWGNLMEAGGLGEIKHMARLAKASFTNEPANRNQEVFGLIIRSTISSEYSAVLLRFDARDLI